MLTLFFYIRESTTLILLHRMVIRMAMSDGNNKLAKILFQVGTKEFRFAINPENYTHKKPHRTATLKTKSRIVVEDFQSDIETINIKGTTGFNPTGKKKDRGFRKIKEMKSFIEDYAESGGAGGDLQEFYFHNFTNDESFVVHLAPEGVSYTQDVESPLTFKYDINLVVLRKAGEPSDYDIVKPEIGNENPNYEQTGGFDEDRDKKPHPDPGGFDEDGDYTIPGTGGSYNPGDIIGNTTPFRGASGATINPQAPSTASYEHGKNSLADSIGA